MAEDRVGFKIKEDGLGEVQVAEEVVVIIAGLAAMEAEGVSSMGGNITRDAVSRLGIKNLSKGIRIDMEENRVTVTVAINISYGYSIPSVSAKVQEKVKNAIETMTGLEVSAVNVKILEVEMESGE